MYESPIFVQIQSMTDNLLKQTDDAIFREIKQQVDVQVDEEELIKALNYDRQQYEKGFSDCKAELKSKINRVINELTAAIEE